MTDERQDLVVIDKVDPFMNDDIMRADPASMAVDRVGGMYVILKALEKSVATRVKAVGEVLRQRVPVGSKLENAFFWINHASVQRDPTLSLEKLQILVAKYRLDVDRVFPIPPPEKRHVVDLEFLATVVPKKELDACYESTGAGAQLKQGAKGDLKRRLAEVVR